VKWIWLMLIVLFFSCKREEKTIKLKEESAVKQVESEKTFGDFRYRVVADFDLFEPFFYTSCSCRNLTNLKGKRDSIKCMSQLYECPIFLRDTLVDLNYDGHKDYAIMNFGCYGSGLKNGFDVFLFDPKKKKYYSDTLFSGLPNPSFFPHKGKLTSFYIAEGCGSGREFHWKNKRWVLAKTFEVCHGENPDWLIRFPPTGDSIIVKRPYQLVPPGNIMETNKAFWD